MTRRPLLVSLVAWIWILACLAGLICSFNLLHKPEFQDYLQHLRVPPLINEIVSYTMLGLGVVMGAFLVEGRNWARYAFAISGAFFCAYVMLVLPSTWLLACAGIFYGVSLLILFLPQSTRYYNRHSRPVWR